VEKEEEIIHQSGELSVLRLSGIHSSSVRPRPLELLAIRLHKEREMEGGRERESVWLRLLNTAGNLLMVFYCLSIMNSFTFLTHRQFGSEF
jgi:hypothetical protein